MPYKPPQPARLREAFRVNRKAPLPWRRAISAGLSMGIPVLAGIALGHFSHGLLASFGGFAYLYARTEPYARRAVQVLLVIISLAITFAAGSLTAGIAWWAAALALGLTGTLSVFICEALDIPPPSALFFIFTCALGASMPATGGRAALLQMGLILLGGAPAWLITMAGWLLEPYEPEIQAVTSSYRALANWMAAEGSEPRHAAQHQAAVALRLSERTVETGSLPVRHGRSYARLVRLNQQAEALFLAMIELSAERADPVDPRLTAAVRSLADAVADPDRACCLSIPIPEQPSPAEEQLCRALQAAVVIAAEKKPQPLPAHQRRLAGDWSALAGALSPNSLVLPRALRMGGVLLAASVITRLWGTERPHWVFISCAAVLMGGSVADTLQRMVQRTAGTILGVFLGGLMLSVGPSGIAVALVVMLLQFLVHLSIGRNYGFAVLFLTPLGFLIAHAGHPEIPLNQLVTERLEDIMLGGLLGLAGTLLFERHASSRRLPGLLSEAIQREGELLQALVTGERAAQAVDKSQLRTALINLRVVYDAAANEMARNRTHVEAFWPVVIAVQRLGFFLIALCDEERRARIAPERLAPLERVFAQLAGALVTGRPPDLGAMPVIPGYPVIGQELAEINQGLQVLRIGEPPPIR